MKRVLLVILSIAVGQTALSGCSQKLTDIQAEYLRMLEEPATVRSVSEIGDFLEKHLSRFDYENADQMLIAFEDHIYSLDGEDMDYGALSDRFGKYMSQPLLDIYDIKISEQDNPMISGAKLLKSWHELCERALFLEIFIKDNKNYQLIREEAAEIYKRYIKAILMGTTETPVFNHSDGSFDERAKNAYTDFIFTYPDTTIAEIIGEFLDYLDSIGFILDVREPEAMTVFSDTCMYLVMEAGKRVLQ